jgi:hypothetical protein
MPISTGVSTTTIHVGGLVKLDDRTSTCQHRIFQSTGAAAIIAEDLIVGIAAERISGSTATVDTTIPVWEANPHVEFRAATKGAALAGSNVGSAFSLGWDSTLNIVYVDLADSTATNQRVVVTELLGSVGDSNADVAFKFLATDRASTNNSSIAYLAFYSR